MYCYFMSLRNRPIVLIILDGFGIAPPSYDNSIAAAKTPFFDSLLNNCPSLLLQASGLNVGLPFGEVGNSEVGHVSIGSGILRYQSLPRIDKSISSGEFFEKEELKAIVQRMKEKGVKLHVAGLLGSGGVHSSQKHLEAIIKFCKDNKIWEDTFLHLYLDGRDTAKDAGKLAMEELIEFMGTDKKVASLSGRFYAMDRNKNWDRVKKAYDAMVLGRAAKTASDPLRAIQNSYDQNVFDEEFEPVVFTDNKGNPRTVVDDSDIVLMFNFRADRARQMTKSLVEKDFDKFEAKSFGNLGVVTFTEYEKDLPVSAILFPVELVENPLAKIFSDHGLKQLHIAETEKYAHVTFFLNGLKEEKFAGEDRILVPSPDVTSYDQKPEMSAYEVMEKTVSAIKENKYDFIAVNFANPDMVGHTGNLEAAVKAVEAADYCFSRVVKETANRGGVAFIVGDHGNAEVMINPTTGEVDKEHNNYPVPFIMAGKKFLGQPNPDFMSIGDFSLLQPVGILADVAPTILKMGGLEIPPEMSGQCLF